MDKRIEIINYLSQCTQDELQIMLENAGKQDHLFDDKTVELARNIIRIFIKGRSLSPQI